jgi:hypothetical protein
MRQKCSLILSAATPFVSVAECFASYVLQRSHFKRVYHPWNPQEFAKIGSAARKPFYTASAEPSSEALRV